MPHVHRLGSTGEYTGPADREGRHAHALPDGTMTEEDSGPHHNHGGGMSEPMVNPYELEEPENKTVPRDKIEEVIDILNGPEFFKKDDKKKKNNAQLFSISDVEVFAAGKWNGDTYTTDDLDEMVRAFRQNEKTLKPVLKLGHDDGQKLLQNDGLPNAGVVSKLRRVGDKLVADFSDIPKAVFNLIKNKAYRKVSSEIYWNIQVNGAKFKRMLSAVSLLGADMPAVTNLKDILDRFSKLESDALKSYALDTDNSKLVVYASEDAKEIGTMGDVNVHKLQADYESMKEKFSALSEDVKKHKAEVKDKDKEVAELREYKKEAEARLAEEQARAEKAENEKFLGELAEIGVPKSANEYISALLEGKKEYTINKKQHSNKDLLKEVLKLYAETHDVNLDEDSDASEGEASDKNADALDRKIKEYAKDNKVSYSDAYKALAV